MTNDDRPERDHHETRAVVRHEQQSAAVELWGSNDPRQMTRRMGEVADAIRDVIRERNLYENIQGKEYVKVEGWSMTGAMVGVFPRTREVRVIEEGHLDAKTVTRKRRGGQGTYDVHYPEFDGVLTYEASVDLITRDGGVVGGAVSLCSRHEEQWRDREDNQIASMAQTRAIAKAYRMTLGFVMPMAGYAATPAEEMTENVVAPRQEAEPKASAPVAARAGTSGGAKAKPFWAAALKAELEKHNLELAQLEVILHERPTNAVVNGWFNAHATEGSQGELVRRLVEEALVEISLTKPESEQEEAEEAHFVEVDDA